MISKSAVCLSASYRAVKEVKSIRMQRLKRCNEIRKYERKRNNSGLYKIVNEENKEKNNKN